VPLYSFKGKKPIIGTGCFIAPSADIVGDALIGSRVSIWFNVVARADINKIVIGDETNVQDLCLLHVGTNDALMIGKECTIGHKAILHGCSIGDNCLIGMGAIIMDGAEIGANSLVAAGCLVPPGKKFPPHSFIIGTPAVLKKELSLEERETYAKFYLHYESVREDYRLEFATKDKDFYV